MRVKRSKQTNAQIAKMMLNERIAAAMAHAKLTPAMLVAKTGATKGAVSQWLNGKTKNLKSETSLAISDATGVSQAWLITGIGDMLPVRRASADPHAKATSKPEIHLENNPEYPSIKRVTFKLSAGSSGFGVDYDSVSDRAPIVFSKSWYESRKLTPNKLFAVKVANGSMEPGLHDGDTVVVNTAQKDPIDGAVFAVNYEGQLVIKRLIRDAGAWWLSSDNVDQRHYPRKICDENTFVIGEIVHKQSERI